MRREASSRPGGQLLIWRLSQYSLPGYGGGFSRAADYSPCYSVELERGELLARHGDRILHMAAF